MSTPHGMQISNQSSEFADERPISACRFSPDGSHLASTSWSGHLKLWTMPTCQHHQTIRAHQDRITGEPWQRLLIGPAPSRLRNSAGTQLRLLLLESSCQMQDKGNDAASSSMGPCVKETAAVLQFERAQVASILHW